MEKKYQHSPATARLLADALCEKNNQQKERNTYFRYELKFQQSFISLDFEDCKLASEIVTRYQVQASNVVSNNQICVIGNLNDVLTGLVDLTVSSYVLTTKFCTSPPSTLHFVRNTEVGVISDAGSWNGYFENDITISENDKLKSLILAAIDREITLHIALMHPEIDFFHAAVLTNNSSTIIFLGSSGSGKSTLAQFLNETGWHLITDDVAPWTGIDGEFIKFPRYSRPRSMQVHLGTMPSYNFFAPPGLHFFTLSARSPLAMCKPMLASEVINVVFQSFLFEQNFHRTISGLNICNFISLGKWWNVSIEEGNPVSTLREIERVIGH